MKLCLVMPVITPEYSNQSRLLFQLSTDWSTAASLATAVTISNQNIVIHLDGTTDII